MRAVILVVLALGLSGCGVSELLKQFTPRSPAATLVVAKGTYAGTLYLMTAAAKAGTLSDEVIVTQLEPARQAAKAAITVATQLLKLNDPRVSDYVNAALMQADVFRSIFEQFKGGQQSNASSTTYTLAVFVKDRHNRRCGRRNRGRHEQRRAFGIDGGGRSQARCGDPRRGERMARAS